MAMHGVAGHGAGLVGSVLGMAAFAPAGSAVIDPLDAARTVRRALADARIKAFDVSALVVSADLAGTPDTVREFARRALGPHGASVDIASVPKSQVIGRAIGESVDGVAIALVYEAPVVLAVCLEARVAAATPGTRL